ncbi:MAG TPA: SPOR domain-containing protein [Balneolaceae bacterium]|nr:SPOR domain-containing protein [Balneolaceae bacterium]
MKIEKEQLIELLVVKTGLDQKSIEKQLDELVGRIRDAADRGKALEVKGFGLFYYSETGDLKFDPSEEFKTEVNFKYTGLEPIEVREAHAAAGVDDIITEDEPNTEISEEVEDEDIWGMAAGEEEKRKEGTETGEEEPEIEESLEVPDTESSEKEESEPETSAADVVPEEELKKEAQAEPEQTGEKSQKRDTPFEDLIGEAFDTMDEEKEEEEQAHSDPFETDTGKSEDAKQPEKTDKIASDEKKIDDFIPADSGPAEEEKPGKSELKKEKPVRFPEKPKKSYQYADDESHAIPINMVIISLSVLIVVVVGYFVVSDLTSSQSPVSTPVVMEQQTERNGGSEQESEENGQADETQAGEEAGESGETGDESVQTNSNVTQAGNQAGTPAESGVELQDNTSVYGLRGAVNENISGGYTIIVHSLRDEGNARRAMEQLQEEGFRAMVFSRELPETGFVWRVGIGQFETLDNARSVADNLPDPLNENNFIQRIQ